MKETLVGYDEDTIYRVYIKDQNKVIRVKDLQIFENYKAKQATELRDHNKMPTFQGFLLENNNDKETEMLASRIDQKINSEGDAEQELPISRTDRKVSARKEEHLAFKAHKSQKITTKHLSSSNASVNNAEDEPESHISRTSVKSINTTGKQIEQNLQISRIDRIVKLSTKA